MQVSETIKSGLRCIEENLQTDISAKELADMAGYSLRHYQQLFSQAIGMPVAAYIRKRRLDKALLEIAAGRRAVDAAFDYGFNSYAGFYKAFVRTYGSSPQTKSSKKKGLCMLTEKELRNILGNWDIPQNLPILNVSVADGTAVSDSVRFVGEEYILKTGARAELLRHIAVTKALAAQGFAAAVPIPTKTGADYLEGEKITLLTRSIPGSPLAKADRFGEAREAFGRKYGQSIAGLHKALAAVEPQLTLAEKNILQQAAEWALPDMKAQNLRFQMALPDSFFADCLRRFPLLAQKLPKQAIHRDPNPANILFDGGEVSGFLDFDFSERNIRLFDPCYCATGILSEWRGVDGIYEKWPEILRGILRGYDSVNPLSAEEKNAVFDVICAIQMICVLYFEDKSEYKELAKTNREMLQFIVKEEARIRSIFQENKEAVAKRIVMYWA